MDVGVERLCLVAGRLVNGKGIQHRTAEVLLQEFYPPRQHRVDVLLANQVKTQLARSDDRNVSRYSEAFQWSSRAIHTISMGNE
jgi:hypothetical protein